MHGSIANKTSLHMKELKKKLNAMNFLNNLVNMFDRSENTRE